MQRKNHFFYWVKLASRRGRKHYPAKSSPRKVANNFFLGVGKPKSKKEINSWDMPPPRTEDLMPLTYGKEKQKELPEYQVGDFPLRPVEKEALEAGGKPALDAIVSANLGGPLDPFQDKVGEYDLPSLVDNDFGAKPNIKPRTLTPVERPTFEEFENLVKLYYISRGKTFKEFLENAIKPHVLLESGFDPHNIHTDLRHVVRGDDPKENNEYFRLGTKMIGQFPNALQIEYGAVHWDKDPPERFYLVVQEETKPFRGGGRHKDVELELGTDKLRDRYVNFNREYHLTGNGTYYVLDRKTGKLVYAEDD